MALGDSWTQLKTDIANWLNRSDLTSSIPDFITLGENRVYGDLRIACMETALSATISSGVISVPTDYKSLKFAYVEGTPAKSLVRKDAEWILANYPTRSASGKPGFIARQGENFIFGPYPDSTYTIKGTYYAKLYRLGSDNLVNWFTINAPEVILYASLAEAADYLQDAEALQKWTAKYAQVRDRVQRENDNEEFSGSPLAMSNR